MDKHEIPEQLTVFLTRASAIPGVAFSRPLTRDGLDWCVDVVVDRAKLSPLAFRRLRQLVKELNEPADGLHFQVFSCREPGWSRVLLSGDDLPVGPAPPGPLAEFQRAIELVPGALVEIRDVDGLGYTVTVYNCGREEYDEARRAFSVATMDSDMRVDVRDRIDDPPPGQQIRFVEEAP